MHVLPLPTPAAKRSAKPPTPFPPPAAHHQRHFTPAAAIHAARRITPAAHHSRRASLPPRRAARSRVPSRGRITARAITAQGFPSSIPRPQCRRATFHQSARPPSIHRYPLPSIAINARAFHRAITATASMASIGCPRDPLPSMARSLVVFNSQPTALARPKSFRHQILPLARRPINSSDVARPASPRGAPTWSRSRSKIPSFPCASTPPRSAPGARTWAPPTAPTSAARRGAGGRGRQVLARHRADQRPRGEDEDEAHGVQRESEPAPRTHARTPHRAWARWWQRR